MTYFTPTHIEKNSLLSESKASSSLSSTELKKTIASVEVDYVTPSEAEISDNSVRCWRGLDFILSHLVEPRFPRDIMTKSLGYKIEAFNKESMFHYFEKSNYQDCRISAYPRLTQYNGINLVAPSLVPIDLDLSNFQSRKDLETALRTTLRRILHLLQARPTALWTGAGYHVYLPINAFILEEEEIFAKFGICSTDHLDLSTKFMRFAEAFFTNNNHDHQHRPSVNSCLLRVPGSYNSKNGEEVKVIQQWDGHRPSIKYMLREFRRYLIQEKLEAIKGYRKKSKANSLIRQYGDGNDSSNKPIKIQWIHSLLQTAISDHRKYCIWRILAPYFVNVRKLSDDESFSPIFTWLDKCDAVQRISFYPKPRVRDSIRRARKIGYYPIGLNALRSENAKLYDLLQTEVQ